jgi:hypothetical protein
MIVKELSIHSLAEEATFYKMLEGFDETKEIVKHSEIEHKEIDKKMDLIVKSSNMHTNS